MLYLAERKWKLDRQHGGGEIQPYIQRSSQLDKKKVLKKTYLVEKRRGATMVVASIFSTDRVNLMLHILHCVSNQPGI